MKFINGRDEQYLREQFEKDMVNDVKILFYTKSSSKLAIPGSEECEYCEETGQLLGEVASLSDKLTVETHDGRLDPDALTAAGIDKVPAIVLTGDSTGRARYFGIPSGYEFMSLVEDIIDISKRSTDLSDRTKEKLKSLNKDVHLQVFVTPT